MKTSRFLCLLFLCNAMFAQSNSSGLNFAPAVDVSSGGHILGVGGFSHLAVADVNGDGKPDMVVADECPIPPHGCGGNAGVVGVLLGNGDGTFQPAVAYNTGGHISTAVAVADVNGDGKPDLVVTNADSDFSSGDGSVSVLLGNGDGTFQKAVPYDAGSTDPGSVAIADVNGDGKPDLIMGTGYLLLGNGDGTFKPAVHYGNGGNEVTTADVNGDGNADIIVLGGGIGVGVFLGNGDGTFQAEQSYPTGATGGGSVAVADVNGDNKLDLLVGSQCFGTNCGSGSVAVLLGNGDGTFQAPVLYGSGAYSGNSIAVADVNGDGKPDAVIANLCTSHASCNAGVIAVLLGNGDGTFQAAETFSSGVPDAIGVAIADVNGDDKPDLLLLNVCDLAGCGPGSSAGVLVNKSISGSSTALVSSLDPSKFGQAVTFTATVTPHVGFDKGPLTGTVSFLDGSATLGSSSLNGSGVATFTTSALVAGTHSITASYGGSTIFAASTSPVLRQVVQGAVAQFSPTSISFGNETVDITSAVRSITLTNTGNVALTISSISITGTDQADFVQSHNCGSSLAAGKGCTISVTFKPSATGTRSAAVSITDNAPKSPQTVSLTGVGVLPAVTFAPASLTFPTQIVFTTSATKSVTLTNSGLGILEIASIAVTGPFTQTHTCGASLNPSAACTLTVTFKPTTGGTLSGTISVTDNAPGSPQKVTLKGTGTDVQLSPSSVNFGTQPKGTTSLPQTITLSNKADTAFNINGITITGADPGDFSQTNTCGTSVASGASCFIKVVFKPTATGARTAAVSVSDTGGGSPQQVSLSGTGT